MQRLGSSLPVPFQIVSEPRQLKAFTDPLRVRILHVLTDREATNLQVAQIVDEPPAKVFHHVRFLADCDLIVLVREQVRGGNVEKYYRATARMFGLRPDRLGASAHAAVAFEAVAQELAATQARWPDDALNWEIRQVRLAPERVAEFQTRLRDLLAEFWGGPENEPVADAIQPVMGFAAVTYRFPVE